MRNSRSELGRTLLHSGISNLVLVGCFVLFANWTAVTSQVRAVIGSQMSGSQVSAMTKGDDPLATARLLRQDNEALTKGVQSSLKGSLTFSVMRQVAESEPAQDGTTVVMETAYEAADDGASYAEAATSEETQGLRVAPILRKDRKTGQLEIGNFKSLSFSGDATQCLEMGYSMLGDAGTSNDLLDVMTASDAITIAKICAKNGSVVISCRNDQITVSPRQSRPDDQCPRVG